MTKKNDDQKTAQDIASLTYWEKRYLQIKSQSITKSDQFAVQVRKTLASASDGVEKILKDYYDKYANEDGVITPETAQEQLKGVELENWKETLADWERMAKVGGYDKYLNMEYLKSRVSREQALHTQLKQYMVKKSSEIVPEFTKNLSDDYESTYYKTTATVEDQFHFTVNFGKFNEDQLDETLKIPWQGSDYMTRTYGTLVDKLPEDLNKVLANGVIQGLSYTDMSQQLLAKYRDVSNSDMNRLVRTEFAHANNQAAMKAYRDRGIDRFKYCAILESNTCDTCQELDGQVFDEEDLTEGENEPLIHPNCRCYMLAAGRSSDDEEDSTEEDSENADVTSDNLDNSFDNSDEKGDNSPIDNDGGDNILDNFNTTINEQKQNKHIAGTYENSLAVSRGENASVLHGDIDIAEAQRIVDKYSGTGEIKYKLDESGNPVNVQEVVKTDRTIEEKAGSDNTGIATKNAKIHYSSTGTHITPSWEAYKEAHNG